MDSDVEQPVNPAAAMNEVDFTRGYENPDPDDAWYRDPIAIHGVVFLISVFLVGGILLVSFFSGNPWLMLLVSLGYVALAIAVMTY